MEEEKVFLAKVSKQIAVQRESGWDKKLVAMSIVFTIISVYLVIKLPSTITWLGVFAISLYHSTLRNLLLG